MEKKLVGKGLSAFKTRGFSGFDLDRNVYMKCDVCGDFISMHPRNKEVCSCGNIVKDIDSGIIECKNGFDNIEIYRAFSAPFRFFDKWR